MNTKNKLFLPCIITVIATLFMLISLVVPYIVVGDRDARDELEELDKEEYISMSILSFADVLDETSEEDASIWRILVAVFAGFTLLALIFAATKHPVLTMIFDILTAGVFLIFYAVLDMSRTYSDDIFDWGIAHYIYIFSAIVTFVCSIWLLVSKIAVKKQNNPVV